MQDALLQQAVIEYRSTVLSALEETENALVNYSQEQARRERLESAVKSNQEAVRLSSELYKAGLTDFLSVLDAQRELYANEDLLAQSRTAQTVNLIALYKALGGVGNPLPFTSPHEKTGENPQSGGCARAEQLRTMNLASCALY